MQRNIRSQWRFELGEELKDKVTGMKGVAIGRCIYLYGCIQYGIVAKVKKDGKAPDCHWYDEGRLVKVGRGVNPKAVKADKNGGPSMGPKGLY